MFSSVVRVVAVISLAFSGGVAQAGLVVFDSTNGLNAGTITNTNNNFNSKHGVRFEVANDISLSLESAYFGVRSGAAADRTINFVVELFEVGNAVSIATANRSVLVAGNATTVVALNNLNSSNWSLSGGKKYTVQFSAGSAAGSLFMAGTSQTSFTQNFVTFDTFVSNNSPVSNNYWIQLNANSASVVPEPATIGLLIGGLGIGLGRRIRRRRRQASTDGTAAKSGTTFGNPLRRLKAALIR